MKTSFSADRWSGVDIVGVRPATLAGASGAATWLCGRCGDTYAIGDSVAVTIRSRLGTTDEIVCPTCAAVAVRLQTGDRACRVLLVEDDAAFRDVVRRHLELDASVEIVGYADDGVQALTELRRLEPDVVVLDLAMPRRHGVDVLADLPAEYPVVVLTGREDLAERCRALRPDVTVLPKSPQVFQQLAELLTDGTLRT
jgi:CheY-like chemotaxis protein